MASIEDDRLSGEWPEGVRIVEVNGYRPEIHPSAWIAPGVTLIGRVWIGPQASVYYGSVLRADREVIEIGAGSNVQDNTVMHSDPGTPLRLGERVSVGHRALVHGCIVGDDVLVGMSSTLLNGCEIGSGSLVAAGAVVLEGSIVPSGSLVAGVPAKVRRALTDTDRDRVLQNARTYLEITGLHRESRVLN